jgi:ATP-dependent Lon protease
MDRTQRQYFLREQLKAIQKELGEDGQRVEAEEQRQKIYEAKMPRKWKRRCSGSSPGSSASLRLLRNIQP